MDAVDDVTNRMLIAVVDVHEASGASVQLLLAGRTAADRQVHALRQVTSLFRTNCKRKHERD